MLSPKKNGVLKSLLYGGNDGLRVFFVREVITNIVLKSCFGMDIAAILVGNKAKANILFLLKSSFH